MPTYDYVIVGAGSAGCVLASRLTEDPAVKVLVVEAGPPDTSDLIHIPAAFSALFRTQQDWDHMTGWEPGLNGRRVYLPRGRTLGGSSSLNAMVYVRGNRADGERPPEPRGADGLPRAPRAVRGHARGRRPGRAGGRVDRAARRAGGRRVGRRLQLAAAPDALRQSAARPSSHSCRSPWSPRRPRWA